MIRWPISKTKLAPDLKDELQDYCQNEIPCSHTSHERQGRLGDHDSKCVSYYFRWLSKDCMDLRIIASRCIFFSRSFLRSLVMVSLNERFQLFVCFDRCSDKQALRKVD